MHQARTDGETWSAIGESMGVTKQAAQKRFVVAVADRDDGLLSRFTPRARHVLSAARVDAQRGGAPEVETVHLVLALDQGTDGLATACARRHGHKRRASSATVAKMVAAKPVRTPRSQVRFAAKSRAVLQGAVEEALQLQHNYIGTEHLLLAIVAQPETDGARVLAGLGVTRRKCLTRVKGMLQQIVAERTGQ